VRSPLLASCADLVAGIKRAAQSGHQRDSSCKSVILHGSPEVCPVAVSRLARILHVFAVVIAHLGRCSALPSPAC
jgi:hypothetical protein